MDVQYDDYDFLGWDRFRILGTLKVGFLKYSILGILGDCECDIVNFACTCPSDTHTGPGGLARRSHRHRPQSPYTRICSILTLALVQLCLALALAFSLALVLALALALALAFTLALALVLELSLALAITLKLALSLALALARTFEHAFTVALALALIYVPLD